MFRVLIYLKVNGAKMAAFTTGTFSSTADGNTAFNMEKVAIDDKNKSATYKTIEGTGLQMFKSFKIYIEVTPRDEGCVLHWTLEYEKLNANVEDPKAMLHVLVDTCKDVDAHLTQQANTQSSPQLQCN
ncbi:hypothetical protein Pint_22319 [Pistacia integerrima]|uniref:Uncharacterized protein n=1 Tax=Pistacia integerrima TaxID=434235 RepID=A0ACC0YL27_9ROSI|nr:hypothetical protein Pint_22319 [Pistacia integerrima]